MISSHYYFFNPLIMRSLNKVMLMGHLGADVDLRQTKSGLPVASFPIAINRNVQGEDGKTETVDYHKIVVWGKFSEVCEKFLAKGAAVYVEGKLMNRSYDDKDGNKQYKTEVIADNVNFLTFKKSKSGDKSVELEPIEKK